MVRNFLSERFSTIDNEISSRHFHQLKDSCHTSIKNQEKYLVYVILRVDIDSYPFRNVLPRIQEDTSTDILWL